jgi:hypothetical protein
MRKVEKNTTQEPNEQRHAMLKHLTSILCMHVGKSILFNAITDSIEAQELALDQKHAI